MKRTIFNIPAIALSLTMAMACLTACADMPVSASADTPTGEKETIEATQACGFTEAPKENADSTAESAEKTAAASESETTDAPTQTPAAKPECTDAPTAKPTAVPTAKPTSVPTAKPTAKPTAAPTAKPTETAPQFPEEFMRVNVDGRSYAVHQQLNYAKTYIEGSGFLHADGLPASILVHDENFISKLPTIPLGRNMSLVPMNGCKISSGISVYDLASREYLGGGLTVDGLRSAARSSADGVIAFASASCTGRYIPELDDNEMRSNHCCFILKP